MDIKFSNDDWNKINRSTIYSYTGKKVKGHTSVFITTMILILLIVALCAYLTVTEKIDNGLIAILYIVLFLVFVTYIVKNCNLIL